MSSRLFSAGQRDLLDQLLDAEGLSGEPDRIPRRGGDRGVAPLSLAQERIWFFEQMWPGSALYVMAGALRIRGALDQDVLRRSVLALVARHEALRTGFVATDGVPSQRIYPAAELQLSVPVQEVDAAGHATVAEQVARLAGLGFDLRRPPLLRALLLRLTGAAEPEWVLVLSLHHIVADGWSLGVLLDELGTSYAALATGSTPRLPELTVQYPDFASWQRSWLGGTELDGQLAYWRERLAGFAPVDLVPEAHTGANPVSGDQLPVDLPGDLVARLRAVGSAANCTLYMVLLAAFAVFLGRWGRTDDVVVGAPVAGRDRTELEGLVGFFVNTLPIRVAVPRERSFADLLGDVRTGCLDGYRNQHVPFDRVVAELHPDRSPLGRSPLVRQLLVLHNTPPGAMRVPGLDIELLPVHTRTAKFELELELAPTEDGGLSGWLEFATGVFGRDTAGWLTDGLRVVLEAVAADQETAVGELPVLTADGYRQVVHELPVTESEPVTTPTVPAWFVRTAAAQPEHPAVLLDGEPHGLSYAQLEQASFALATALHARGIGVESRVGVCFERGSALIVALLGVLRAGAAFVPMEPSYPDDRLRQLAQDSELRLVLCDPADTDRLADLEVETLGFADPGAPAWQQQGGGQIYAGVRPGQANAAYVLFTSGSTGRPKGAANTHGALTNRLSWMYHEHRMDATHRVLQKTPIGFDVSIWELLLPLVSGATLVFAVPDGHRNPEYLHDLIDRQRITICHFVPSMLSTFVQAARAQRHPSLRTVVCSGEELPASLADQVGERYPQVELHNLYGPTEAAIDVSAQRVDPADALPPSIGRPARGVRLYVLDGEMRPQPVGIPGQLHIGGVQLARGYVGRPGLTAERFVPNPFEPGLRLYATGDLARWRPDGDLEFLGRLDGQLKIRGNRVEPAEIEHLLREHPAVTDAMVLAGTATADTVELIAYLTLASAEAATGLRADQVRRWQTVFDQTYLDAARPEQSVDPTFDIRGWNSSYTNQPIPAAEMAEWVDGIVHRALECPHERIVEIGAGTGMLLFRLAGHCVEYLATDVSEESIARLAAHRHLLGGDADRVRLSRQAAEDFTGIPDRAADLVLINSVVQYFPDADYLVRVLDGAVAAVRDGGSVLVGDVRCLPTQRAFRTAVELSRKPTDTPVVELRQAVDGQLAREEELVIDPALFAAYGARQPRVSSVAVLPKLGERDNELNAFRYDVLVTVGEPVSAVDYQNVPWAGRDRLRDQLAELPSAGLWVTGIPDPRIHPHVRAAELLDTPGVAAGTAGELRDAVLAEQTPSQATPGQLVAEAAALGHHAVAVLAGATPGSFDLVVRASAVEPDWSGGGQQAPEAPCLAEFTNNPMRVAERSAVVAALRERVREALPDYMMPAHFVVLDAFPVGPTGKADRAALRRIEPARPALRGMYVAPRTATERAVTEIWADLLDLDRVGVNDDFFELGGHSLLATRVVARIEATLGARIGVADLLETSSPAGLAALVERRCAAQDHHAAHGDWLGAPARQAPIQRIDRSRFAVDPPAGRDGAAGS